MGEVLRSDFRCSHAAHRRLVRHLPARYRGELPEALGYEEVADAVDDRSLDAPRRQRGLRRRCGIRPHGRDRRLRHRLSSTLVRLLPEGRENIGGCAGPRSLFLDGHRDTHGRLFHGGSWLDARQWPPATSRPTLFYLHADGSLSEQSPAAAEDSSTRYRFDPSHPVPTVGGGVSARLKDGAFDQRERPDMPGSRPPYLPLRSRNDILVFETPPLAQDTTIAGPVEITLFASSTGTDTDFTAKLVDVYPPSADFPQGFDMNLTDGILRASYRDDSPSRNLLVPGQIYRLTIRPFDTANVFKKGHRIRLDISSSNFPRFDVNPNTGEPLGSNRRQIEVDNTVYHDPQHPSAVTLWLLR